VMVGVNVFAADTAEEARFHFTSLQQQFINLRRGTPGQLPPPVESIAWSDAERAGVEHSLACSVVGAPADVEAGLRSVIDQTQADELIITAQIFDQQARLRSFELASQARDAIGQGA